MTDEVTEAIRLIIQELRENFNSFAQDGKVVINRGLWMDATGFVVHNGPVRRNLLDDEAGQAGTLDEWSDALRRSLERRTSHSQKRVDRLTAEIERAKRIIAVLKR